MIKKRWGGLNLNFDIEKEIDDEKIDIIKSDANKILITAPPGTGKTFTAILRAKYLINNKINENQKILLLTFTNNAIKQISETKKEFLTRKEISKINIKTYYSFYFDLISKFGRYDNLPSEFDIMLPYMFEYYYQNFIKKFQLKDKSSIRNIFENAIAYKYGFIKIVNKKITRLAIEFLTDKYLEEKQIDFNNLRNYALHILSESKFIRRHYNNKHPYIIVDEFQDTNKLEWEFIKYLTMESSLMCLADNNQQIFRFKGASVNRLDDFRKEYSIGEKDEYSLKKNYRNSQEIRSFSKLILKMKEDYSDIINKKINLGENIEIKRGFYSLSDQVYKTKWEIFKLAKKYNKIGILTKKREDAKKVSDYLAKKTKKTNSIYNTLITDRENEILKEDILLNIMKLLKTDNKDIFVSLSRKLDILTQNNYGFEARWNKAIIENESYNKFDFKSMHHSSKGRKVLKKLVEIDSNHNNFREIYHSIVDFFNKEISGLIISEDFMLKIFSRVNNISVDKQISIIKSVDLYLKKRNQRLNNSHILGEKGIYVMTIHKSKGKQFDMVYIFNFNDKIIPHIKEIKNGNYLDSLNLFYVGVTRAKYELKILCSNNSKYHNESRFLKPF